MLEYDFFLNAPGRISLAPFELSVPAPEEGEAPEDTGGEIRRISFRSPAIQFTVRAPGEAGSGRSSSAWNPRISWKEIPALLRPGEEAELTLVHQGWDPRFPLPAGPLLIPRTPIGAILEAVPPRQDDEAAGVLLRLRLIPLEEGRLNIPGFSVPAGDYRLNIPALSIPVSRAGIRVQPAASPAPVLPAPPPEEPSSPAFPAFPETLPEPLLPFKAGCADIREQARNLWDRGLRVEALAGLRRGERDYAGGPALIPLRREAEKLLGLPENGDESWRPRVFLTGLLVISALLTAAFLFQLSRKKRVTPGAAWCYKVIGIFTPLFALSALFSLWMLGAFAALELPLPGVSGLSRPALTREAEAFRVPGPAGTAVFRFEEGRRVLVRSVRGDWAYAEIPGRETGRAGWVRTESLVFY
jgi:hypothetical protein